MAKLLGPRSGTAWAGRTGEHKHRACCPRPARLRKTCYQSTALAILTQFDSQRVWMLCRYRAATSHFLFHLKWNFRWNWREIVADQGSAHRFAQSFRAVIGLCVRIWHRNKSSCSESNPVQSSRCKSTTCPSVSEERATAQIWNLKRTAPRLQIAARKSLETMSGMILNRSQAKFTAKSVANEMRYFRAMQWRGRASIFDLKISWAIRICKQLSTVLLTDHL